MITERAIHNLSASDLGQGAALPGSQKDILDWLVLKLSEALAFDPRELCVTEPLSAYGLNSIQAVSIVGDLESWLGREFPATLLWDCNTLSDAAAFIAGECNCS
jgi:acyl carrier protein